ncbi:MAG: tRNA (N6-isopentenyl adenosine(37)-C2)-methylthiotransferase MiaB [Candidatus Nanopelagicales bacterium]|nr:tRNA (N6-isopentenyl adenosine(37)-C2)-methylthiotransferase MiaB [Candidatus Nanopelagicales bacterium]
MKPDSMASRARTFEVRTIGCQMNAHDSERIAGVLHTAGFRQASPGDQADVIVINTCAVRENADNRLYGNLGILAARKRENPHLLVAVAGCLAQKDRERILERASCVDVVIGTHNVDALPVLLERASGSGEAQIEIIESLRAFPSDLPARRASAHSAWVSISVGCNNTCTYCIVPKLRGRQRDRRQEQIVAEVRALAESGAREITLLGQNVNAYGVQFGQRGAFAELLRTVGAVPGIRRVRFTSPHPRDFTADVIAAMAETPTVMPHLHIPLQSGSDDVLRRMRRSYRADKFLRTIADVRASIQDAAFTTDIIVGFPGETDDDFDQTMAVVEQSRFAGAFTFKYSPRPGTPAAGYEDQVPADVVASRYERLAKLVARIAMEENSRFTGRTVEVMISDSSGRKDGSTSRVSGRARDNRLVHALRPEGVTLAPGDVVSATVTLAAPHYLVADKDVSVTDPFPQATVCGDPSSVTEIGMPTVR